MATEYEWTPWGTQLTRVHVGCTILREVVDPDSGPIRVVWIECAHEGGYPKVQVQATTFDGDAAADRLAEAMQATFFTLARYVLAAGAVPPSIAHTQTVQPTGDFLGDVDRMLAQ